MAVFSRLHTWVSNEVLTAAALNAEFDNIISNMDPDGIEGSSANVSAMQATTDPGGVGTESLASTLTGELQRLRFKIKQIIGQAQWYSTPVGSLSTGGVGASSLATDAVTTIKIQDGAVTQAKRAALGQVISTNSGTYSTNSTSFSAVTNLSNAITTTGRLVFVGLIADPAQTDSVISLVPSGGADASMVGNIRFKIDGGVINTQTMQIQMSSATITNLSLPPSAFWFVYPATTGAHTFTVEANVASATESLAITHTQLVTYEL